MKTRVPMPAGSSSDTPVIRPGPSQLKNVFSRLIIVTELMPFGPVNKPAVSRVNQVLTETKNWRNYKKAHHGHSGEEHSHHLHEHQHEYKQDINHSHTIAYRKGFACEPVRMETLLVGLVTGFFLGVSAVLIFLPRSNRILHELGGKSHRAIGELRPQPHGWRNLGQVPRRVCHPLRLAPRVGSIPTSAPVMFNG
ncbi:MAG: hypothetical protein ACYCXU_04300 [Thermoleophilia bacterium]